MELKGISKNICEHRIEHMANVQSIRQTQYWMNPNYALKVREDLVKLLDANFIYPIETTPWLKHQRTMIKKF